MKRWLTWTVVALVVTGCLEEADDPRPPPRPAEKDGGRFEPGPKPPPEGGYGYGYGSGSGAPPRPDPDAATDAGPEDAGAD